MSDPDTKNEWSPISAHFNPRIVSKVRGREKQGFFKSTFFISIVTLLVIFSFFFIPNATGIFQSGAGPDLVAFVDTNVPVIDGIINVGEYASSYEDVDNNIVLYAEHNSTHLFIGIKCSQTGWCAIGFNGENPTHPMIKADIKMAWVDDTSGDITVVDRIGAGTYEPNDDTDLETNLADFYGTQGTDNTQFEFVLILDEAGNNDEDRKLSVGSKYVLIYAQNTIDDISVAHTQMAAILFEIQ